MWDQFVVIYENGVPYAKPYTVFLVCNPSDPVEQAQLRGQAPDNDLYLHLTWYAKMRKFAKSQKEAERFAKEYATAWRPSPDCEIYRINKSPA